MLAPNELAARLKTRYEGKWYPGPNAFWRLSGGTPSQLAQKIYDKKHSPATKPINASPPKAEKTPEPAPEAKPEAPASAPATEQHTPESVGKMDDAQLQDMIQGKSPAASPASKPLGSAVKPKRIRDRDKEASSSLREIVKKMGGINIGSLEAHGYDVKALMESGLAWRGLFKREGGSDVSEVAKTMHTEGHIEIPGAVYGDPEDKLHGGVKLPKNGPEYLLDQLVDKVKSLHADRESEYEKSYLKYVKEQQDAEQDHTPAEVAEAVRSGEADGDLEASEGDPSEDLGGMADEGEAGAGEVDFEFGANAPKEGGQKVSPEVARSIFDKATRDGRLEQWVQAAVKQGTRRGDDPDEIESLAREAVWNAAGSLRQGQEDDANAFKAAALTAIKRAKIDDSRGQGAQKRGKDKTKGIGETDVSKDNRTPKGGEKGSADANAIKEVVDSLSPEQQRMVEMVRDGHGYDEIAKEFGTSKAGVSRQFADIKEAFKEHGVEHFLHERTGDKTRYMNENHVPAGVPEGGQFTGKAEHGQSPNDMAGKFKGGSSTVKAPHQMSRKEHLAAAEAAHKDAVGKYLAGGGEVTSEIAADYPDLAKQHGYVAPTKEAKAEPPLTDKGNAAIVSVKGFLDGIRNGNISNDALEQSLVPLSSLPPDELNTVLKALKISGTNRSRKAAIDSVRTILKNQSEMWVKSQAHAYQHDNNGHLRYGHTGPILPEVWQEILSQAKGYGPQGPQFIRAVMEAMRESDGQWDAIVKGRQSFLTHGSARYERGDLRQRVEAAASETNHKPSDAQKKAGNYAKGKVNIQGLPITLESPKGSVRSGKSREGKEWSTTMAHHYGYIRSTESDADGDHIDVFIGPDPESELVFVVDQIRPGNGHFDEHKCMIGFTNESDARDGYLACYSEGWQGLGDITSMKMSEFKTWIAKGKSGEPISTQVSKKRYEYGPRHSPPKRIDGAVARLQALAEYAGEIDDEALEDEVTGIAREFSADELKDIARKFGIKRGISTKAQTLSSLLAKVCEGKE